MKYYFAGAQSYFKPVRACGVKRYLISYAQDRKAVGKFVEFDDVMVDSGAFSVWKSGHTIDIDAYIAFCKSVRTPLAIKGMENPRFDWKFVNLDVIPTTGAGKAEIIRCAEEGRENYKYIRSRIGRVIPVYHYGEPLSFLKWYMDNCDFIIGLSPANDTSEKVKRRFLAGCFNLLRGNFPTHGFGYSSFPGMELFPFYSVDSLSYRRVRVPTREVIDGAIQFKSFFAYSALEFLYRENIRKFLAYEAYITQLWKMRGVEWEDLR